MATLATTSSTLWRQRLGKLGAALALAILGASVLLRLATELTPEAHSVLPPALEQATRWLHRICASTVALLALGVVLRYRLDRATGTAQLQPTLWIVATTVLLALIGPLTPGYRVAAITVLNVSLGVLLLMAFWWLRESAASDGAQRGPMGGLARGTLIAFIAHIATGAGASACQMLGLHWPVWLHLASAVLCLALLAALLIEKRRSGARAQAGKRLEYLLFTQLALGAVLLWLEQRPLGLSFAHAMLTPFLAMALVSLIQRDAPGAAPR